MLVYLAAPLFSAAERQFNAQITKGLEAAGFDVFLPQRDGAERDRPPYDAMPPEERRVTMFNLDVAKVLECDAIVIVLDGRVPDEGACFELGFAYGHKRLGRPDKLLIGFHTDVRAAFIGARLNPMLAVALDAVVADEKVLIETLRRRRALG